LSNGPDVRQKVLIVDGVDRTSGGWPLPNHNFVAIYGTALLSGDVSFDSAPNEAIEDSLVDLNSFSAVFWILGDESTTNETFSKKEQTLVKDYLENGGQLFISGAEIASDLDRDAYGSADENDEEFLNDYLKINFKKHETDLDSAHGMQDGILSGLSIGFGDQSYPISGVDVIALFGEKVTPVFEYTSGQYAGIQYHGTFGNSNSPGKLVLLTFPFETVSGIDNREQIIASILDYFFGPTSISEKPIKDTSIPVSFRLFNGYPNPFNPQTKLSYDLPSPSHVELRVYDTLGKRVQSLAHQYQEAGHHSIPWKGQNQDGLTVPSGVYFAHLRARTSNGNSSFQKTVKLIFSK